MRLLSVTESRWSALRAAALAAALVVTPVSLAPLSAASAQAADPAAVKAEAFNTALLGASKRGEAKGGKLRGLIEQSFNMSVMAENAVGPSWAKMSAADHTAIIEALTRYTAARFEHDLGQYNGQKITLDPAVQVRGPDHLVKAQLIETNEAPTRLIYRMREYGGAWKVIDVFYNGVSQLATERADFAAAITTGAGALVKKLDEASAKLRS